MNKPSIIITEKTVSQTLSDLRRLFTKQNIDDWEPIPAAEGQGYTVRYYRNKNWTTIGSLSQPTKAMNLRVCFQVIDNLFRWEARGVSGVVKGTTFMGGELIVSGKEVERESFDEACATLGIGPEASIEEIKSVWRVKIQYAHPDRIQGEDAKKQAEERFKRLQKAYELIMKVKGEK